MAAGCGTDRDSLAGRVEDDQTGPLSREAAHRRLTARHDATGQILQGVENVIVKFAGHRFTTAMSESGQILPIALQQK